MVMNDDRRNGTLACKRRLPVHPTYALDVICLSAAKNLRSSCRNKTLSRCCKIPMQLGFALWNKQLSWDWIPEQKSVRPEHCQALIYTNNNWSTCSPFFCTLVLRSNRYKYICTVKSWTWTWWSHISWGLSTISIIHFLVSSERKQICDVTVTRIICVYNKRWQGQQMACTMLK